MPEKNSDFQSPLEALEAQLQEIRTSSTLTEQEKLKQITIAILQSKVSALFPQPVMQDPWSLIIASIGSAAYAIVEATFKRLVTQATPAATLPQWLPLSEEYRAYLIDCRTEWFEPGTWRSHLTANARTIAFLFNLLVVGQLSLKLQNWFNPLRKPRL